MGHEGAARATVGPSADRAADDRRARLADVAARIQPTTLAGDQRLPVLPALEALVPGLRRGSTLSVDGPAATSLALAAASGPSQDGAWVAAVGFPSLGLLAAAELGVALERLVLVADPGAGDDGDEAAWPSVVAALVDAFEVVLVHAGRRVRAADGRRLVARTRERGAVLVQVGAERATASVWPEGADAALTVVDATWEGLGEGHGHLRARRVVVEAGGRRGSARPRRAELWLPSADGAVEAVLPEPVPLRPAVAEGA
jgi:hypothetical protein